MSSLFFRIAGFFLLSLGAFWSTRAAEIVPYGSSWKYFVGTVEASSPDTTAWRKAGFDDRTWSSGAAPIGYANPPNSPAEFSIATVVPSSAEGNYSCVFIRGTFVAKSPAPGNVFTVNVNVDDGCVVWINGVEVGRYNVPDGDLTYDQWAVSAGEEVLNSFSITNGVAGPVSTGANLIAVQLFNANSSSSDIFFDLSLESTLDEVSPVIIAADPPQGGTVTQLNHIDVTFGENVSGVDASDLLINGVPASGVSAISPREYNFTFPDQPNGPVTVTWISASGIADLAGNAFGGGSWTYSVQPADNRAAVIISEFLADNQHGIKDDDSDRSDWIELLNTSSAIADLNGWFLTDDPLDLTKWRFPDLTLDTGKYLLVFASGKNRTNTAAPLHTNFKIEKSGGYLALVDPQTNIVSEFNPYPAQRADISYGRDPVNKALTGFLNPPTPGTANVVSGSGFAAEVTISIPGGVYTNNSLSIKLTAPAGQIRYTTDGTVPTTSSTLYSAPISITGCIVLKARVFQTGLLPGPVAAAGYTLIDSSVQTFTSNLPLLILSTGGRGISQDVTPRTLASVVAVDTFRGRSAIAGKPEFVGQGGIEVRGQSSTGFPKLQYNFSFEDPYRQDINVGVFGLPEGNDWAIYAPYSDKPFLQNFLAYELYEKMGHYSVRRRFVEVFLNTSGGKLNYSQDYAGVYILVEKIRIDKNRVDIDKLNPYDSTEPDISGGYMFKKDKDSPGDYNFSTPGSATAGFSSQALKLHQPKPVDATIAQKRWLQNYLTQMEKALYAPNWKTATGTNHWSYYIDADSFVDFHWIVEFAKQIDGYRLSNYFYKPRNGKVHMSPIWDWNLSFGNADYLDGANTANWYWQELGDNEHIWLRRLMCGTADSNGSTGDADFNQKIVDRWSELRTNVLSSTNVIARAQELAGMLSEAAGRDFQRWPRLGAYVWPNPPFYANPTTYAGIMQSFTNWIKVRYAWIDSQFLPVPTFDLAGCIIRPGSSLTLGGGSAGAIYYTLDGTDPRLPGGATSPKALRFTGAINLQNNAKVVARRLNAGKWSGPSVQTYMMQRPELAITEIMYHPAAPAGARPYRESDYEFIELRNTGTNPVLLAGVTVGGGIQYTWTNGTLAAGGYIVLAKNISAFQSLYGTEIPVAGPFSGELSNSGDTVTVTGALGEPIATVTFKDEWYPITDGAGFSLVPRYESLGGTDSSDRIQWEPSAQPGGSPGAVDPGVPQNIPRVVISELLSHPSLGSPQKIELQNLSSGPADIGGWFISDNLQNPTKFRIAAHTVIAPGGFAVLTSDEFGSGATGFTFSADGEEVYLFSADSAGKLSGYVHGFKFGAQAEGVSFGRYLDSVGQELFVAQKTSTFGGTNSGPFDAPVIISEIMYHPPDVVTNGLRWNNAEDEFIEIVNRSRQAVNLWDPANPTNTWRLDGGVHFRFPPDVTLAPNGFALIVNFDPVAGPALAAAFRAKYSVESDVPLFGPYAGNLGNESDRVSLEFPDVPGANGRVSYIQEDEITYSNQAPWNSGADGIGFSLSRIDLDGFGNDSARWTAAKPSAGSFVTPAASPFISVQPRSQFASAGQNVLLSVQANGLGPLRYEWRFKGRPLPQGTTSEFGLNAVQPTNSGDYSVVVYGPDGATTSQPAFLTIIIDHDQDGMADEWEFANGLNPFDPSDAAIDSDGDGLTNYQEYIAGTNPRVAEDNLDLTVVQAGELRFFAIPRRSYSIFSSESLVTPIWQKLLDVPASLMGSEASVIDSPQAKQRYYRVVTPAR